MVPSIIIARCRPSRSRSQACAAPLIKRDITRAIVAARDLLVGWGWRKRALPTTSYQYVSVPVAWRPHQLQGFEVDIVIRVDHLAVFALLVVELCVIGA